MPAWNDLLNEFDSQPSDQHKSRWLSQRLTQSLGEVRKLREGRNVLLYASAFLQKPGAPPASIQLTYEELNGFMSCVYGMDCSKNLTLLIHSPGGVTNAAETLVAYLRSKFSEIDVIVPAFAMSAGTMIALAADRIVMGRQSQLGPIDPQMPTARGYVSARAVVDQFNRARLDIVENKDTAHLWAPILQALGPSLLVEAQNALDYGERMVAQWLGSWMFRNEADAVNLAAAAARHFNDATSHKSHGRRIDRDEARTQHIVVEDLERDQSLQEAVLTAYHVMTIIMEKSPASKLLVSHHDRRWFKNLAQ